jgi:hypothetical protein
VPCRVASYPFSPYICQTAVAADTMLSDDEGIQPRLSYSHMCSSWNAQGIAGGGRDRHNTREVGWHQPQLAESGIRAEGALAQSTCVFSTCTLGSHTQSESDND